MTTSPVSIATPLHLYSLILRTARVPHPPCNLRNFRFSTATKKLWVARASLRLVRLQYLFHTVMCLVAIIHDAGHLSICQFNDMIQLWHSPVYPPQVSSQHTTRLHRVN